MQIGGHEPSTQLARDHMDDRASPTRDTPLPAMVLAGILSIIESVLGAKIAPEQPLMEVRIWRHSACYMSSQHAVISRDMQPKSWCMWYSLTGMCFVICWWPHASADWNWGCTHAGWT